MYVLTIYDDYGDTYNLYFHNRKNAEERARKEVVKLIEAMISCGDTPNYYGFDTWDNMISDSLKCGYCEDIFYLVEAQFED